MIEWDTEYNRLGALQTQGLKRYQVNPFMVGNYNQQPYNPPIGDYKFEFTLQKEVNPNLRGFAVPQKNYYVQDHNKKSSSVY